MPAIHDWELGERQSQRNFRIVPESVKTETALYHGECGWKSCCNVINHEREKISNQIVISIFISLDSLPDSSSLSPFSRRIYAHTAWWEIWDNRCYCCTHSIYIPFYISLFLYNVIRCCKIICGSCSRAWCNGGNWNYKDRLWGTRNVGTWKEDCGIHEIGKWHKNTNE